MSEPELCKRCLRPLAVGKHGSPWLCPFRFDDLNELLAEIRRAAGRGRV